MNLAEPPESTTSGGEPLKSTASSDPPETVIELVLPNAPVPAVTRPPETFIALKDGRSLIMIKASEIRAIQAEGSYCHILIPNNRKIMIKQSISNWQTSLPPQMFLRVSKSLLVNFLSLVSMNIETRKRSQLLLNGLDKPLVLSCLESQRLRDKTRLLVRE